MAASELERVLDDAEQLRAAGEYEAAVQHVRSARGYAGQDPALRTCLAYYTTFFEAEAARVQDRTRAAMAAYRHALALSAAVGINRYNRRCLQMLGVCYQVRRDYRRAIYWLDLALLPPDMSPAEQGNILRDRGYGKSALGDHEAALADLEWSLQLLDGRDETGYAATLGFIGRAYRRQGNLRHALAYLRQADAALPEGRPKLYNLLHLASTLDEAARRLQGEESGHLREERDEALEVIAGLIPQYGSPKHGARAAAIRRGGVRWERPLGWLLPRVPSRILAGVGRLHKSDQTRSLP